MYEVKVVSEFSSAHRLRYYKGKCEELHGHNWRVEVSVQKDELDRIGMAVDFKKLKDALKKILGLLDHKYLNDLSYFKKINPTSENIAKFIYGRLNRSLSAFSCQLIRVTVWETDTSAASYYKK